MTIMPTKKDHGNDPAAMLRPEERLLSVQEVPATTPVEPPSPLEALQLLAGVSNPSDIGKNGPLVASRALAANQHRKELRLYEALFGRDSLISAYFLLDQFPALARITLLKLAELQGVVLDEASEEEPGEVVHEARDPNDPIAKTLTETRGWHWPYYGSIDATPLFVIVAGEYIRRHDRQFLKETYTDRTGRVRPIAYAIRQAVAWMLQKSASNPDGLVESQRLNQHGGHINQAWKDSRDSYHHADGSLANAQSGVASIEVQGYVYDALLIAGEVLNEDFGAAAQQLKTTVLERFWIEDEQGAYFALGSDRDSAGKLRLLRIRTSNMGHLLNSRLLDGNDREIVEKKRLLVQTLFSPSLLTAYGIRTLASHENRFRPHSYHNGSVWPWDTFYIALGLLRQGFRPEAEELWQKIERVLAATKRFPEFICGADNPKTLLPSRLIRAYDTQYKFEHAIEQPPQEIQAWTVAAAVAIEHSRQQQ
jgi:glycogen debranching enzyme